MGKLVRDKIPEIIINDGETPITEKLNAAKYGCELYKKAREEVEELITSRTLNEIREEMADILEVLYAICEFEGLDFKEVQATRERKLSERGGFKNRIFWYGNKEN